VTEVPRSSINSKFIKSVYGFSVLSSRCLCTCELLWQRLMLSCNLHINYRITFYLLRYEALIAAASTHKSPAVSTPCRLSYCYAIDLRNTQYFANRNSISSLNERNKLTVHWRILQLAMWRRVGLSEWQAFWRNVIQVMIFSAKLLTCCSASEAERHHRHNIISTLS
jgi:hypothetical protein